MIRDVWVVEYLHRPMAVAWGSDEAEALGSAAAFFHLALGPIRLSARRPTAEERRRAAELMSDFPSAGEVRLAVAPFS